MQYSSPPKAPIWVEKPPRVPLLGQQGRAEALQLLLFPSLPSKHPCVCATIPAGSGAWEEVAVVSQCPLTAVPSGRGPSWSLVPHRQLAPALPVTGVPSPRPALVAPCHCCPEPGWGR